MDYWVYIMGGIVGLLGYFVADLGSKVSKLDREMARLRELVIDNLPDRSFLLPERCGAPGRPGRPEERDGLA